MTSKRLARLVRIKKLVERQKAADLAEEERRLTAAEAQATSTETAISDLYKHQESADVSAVEIVAAGHWQGRLARKLHEEQAVVAERATEVDSSRDTVREAWRERRLLEGMHERAALTEAEEAAMGDRKSNEAIALSIYSRRGDGGS